MSKECELNKDIRIFLKKYIRSRSTDKVTLDIYDIKEEYRRSREYDLKIYNALAPRLNAMSRHKEKDGILITKEENKDFSNLSLYVICLVE